MSEQNITLKMSSGIFSYRIGAIIIHSDRVLMAQNNGSPFYYSVGGRGKFGEAARDAVLREAFEETQIKFEIDRLAFIHENFCVLENEPFHELALFFIMKTNNQVAEMKSFNFIEEYSEVTLHWLPICRLGDFLIYPEFFKTELNNLSNNVKHFITKNGITYRAN